jgi:hypothetical protein
VERLPTLWIAGMLNERLSRCPDYEINSLMTLVEVLVSIFEPSMALCEHAKRRLFPIRSNEHHYPIYGLHFHDAGHSPSERLPASGGFPSRLAV